MFSRFGPGLQVRETGTWRGWATQFLNWLSKFSALFFSDGSKKYQTWFKWCSNSNCLLQKKHKNCPAAFGSTSRPRLWYAWVKPLYLARRPSATFLGITWSLGLSSPKRLNKILVAHLQWTLEIVIFILFTKLKIWFPNTNSLRSFYSFKILFKNRQESSKIVGLRASVKSKVGEVVNWRTCLVYKHETIN